MQQEGRIVVIWFRNDLRLHDNLTVHEAVRKLHQVQDSTKVVPVYCFDPRHFERSHWGTLKTGIHRARFLLDCVTDLKQSLRAIGSDLLVSMDKPEEVIPDLIRDASQSWVFNMAEVTSEEQGVNRAVTRGIQPLQGELVHVWGHTLYHHDDVFQGDGGQGAFAAPKLMPHVFTPYKEQVEQHCTIRGTVPSPGPGSLPLPADLQSDPRLDFMPTWEDLPWAGRDNSSCSSSSPADDCAAARPEPPVPHPNAVLEFKGGESAALARLRYYLDSKLVSTYFDTRNGMLGGDYSTKFSPWLAAGCLSPRTIHHEIKEYEAEHGANKSTYWVTWELMVRDFYRFGAIKYGNAIFHEGGPLGRPQPWRGGPEQLARWKAGHTGHPLVDANMRELAATGYMSNRGRQNVASHLIWDLGVDWRYGAAHFEELLLDHDVTSNWGSWVSAAGLTGGRINRFNMVKQSKDYDPEGVYARTWLPELRNVPPSHIHTPWLMTQAEMDCCAVQIGTDYPAPETLPKIPGAQGAASAGDSAGVAKGKPKRTKE